MFSSESLKSMCLVSLSCSSTDANCPAVGKKLGMAPSTTQRLVGWSGSSLHSATQGRWKGRTCGAFGVTHSAALVGCLLCTGHTAEAKASCWSPLAGALLSLWGCRPPAPWGQARGCASGMFMAPGTEQGYRAAGAPQGTGRGAPCPFYRARGPDWKWLVR